MSETYTKLFSSILDSSIWSEEITTKIVWITMLAMSNRHGYVAASIPGLAARAGVSIEAAKVAVDKFLAPDPFSRSKECEGRRIEEVDRGWEILNYERFRDMRDEEARKDYERNRKREARRRSREKECVPDGPRNVPVRPQSPGTNTECPAVSAQAEASAEASAETRVPERASRVVCGEKDPGFLAFWDAYDKKVDRPATLRSWARVFAKPDAELLAKIMAKVPMYVASTPDKSKRRNPATWLNGEGWNDEIVTHGTTLAGKPVSGAPVPHIPNMPLGTPSCSCAGCVQVRRKQA